jgi:uncharacterized protein (DUF2249 family)
MTPFALKPLTLDLAAHAEPTRQAAVLSAFDTLAPGESLLVSGDAPLDPVLGWLQAQRPALFEWTPLGGAGLNRAEIVRRPKGAGRREVTEALAWDHHRLAGLQERAFAAREAGDYTEAEGLFRLFAHGFRRHIGFEEHLLFPEFEARGGLPQGPGTAAVMRSEHREIEALVDQIETQIADPDAGGVVLEARQALQHVLHEHNLREERFLYRGIDRLLTEAERDRLVRRMQAYPLVEGACGPSTGCGP